MICSHFTEHNKVTPSLVRIALLGCLEARRLLVQTDLAVEEVGRKVGYVDAGYFVRSFRHAHNMTPLGWRRAGRP